MVISEYDYDNDDDELKSWNLVTAAHFPEPGTPTQPVEAGYHANAWMRLRHEDVDTLKEVLSDVGSAAQVWAD